MLAFPALLTSCCQDKGKVSISTYSRNVSSLILHNFPQPPNATLANTLLIHKFVSISGNRNWYRKINKMEAQHYWKVFLVVWENFVFLLTEVLHKNFQNNISSTLMLCSTCKLATEQPSDPGVGHSHLSMEDIEQEIWKVLPCGLEESRQPINAVGAPRSDSCASVYSNKFILFFFVICRAFSCRTQGRGTFVRV